MVRVALDAMGSDGAPGPEVEGAVDAVRQGIAAVRLVGDEAVLRTQLKRFGGPPAGLEIVGASEVIRMEDAAAQAARGKKDSSMRVAFDLCKRGEADAVVSAGHSGAFMACALFVLKRVPGVDRPAVVASVPTPTGQTVVLDVGANVDCKPDTLVRFALLGAAYAQRRYGCETPRVGLLSNGTEAGKGTAVLRDACALLQSGPMHGLSFHGYVEGTDLFSGQVDVVVTDGFTGNILLKSIEGTAETLIKLLRAELSQSWRSRAGAALAKQALGRLKKRLSYDEVGGAPLLGINGVAVLAHGRSTPKAIRNAVSVAADFSRAGFVPALQQSLKQHESLWKGRVTA